MQIQRKMVTVAFLVSCIVPDLDKEISHNIPHSGPNSTEIYLAPDLDFFALKGLEGYFRRPLRVPNNIVLFLRLGFSGVASTKIRRSEWDVTQVRLAVRRLRSDAAAADGAYPGAEVMRGPADLPGYWVVTGAKLCIEGGKVALKVKYSLLIAEVQDYPE
uniref:Uncharacterized protein n=1 Tax=Oryza punctata TaxID=4537 RepID=A0A0E0L5K6_ORYPU